MDMTFNGRADRTLDQRRDEVRLDHQLLVAALEAHQQANVARGSGATPKAEIADDLHEALTELLIAGPARREASIVQQGCFSRVEAGRRVNDE